MTLAHVAVIGGDIKFVEKFDSLNVPDKGQSVCKFWLISFYFLGNKEKRFARKAFYCDEVCVSTKNWFIQVKSSQFKSVVKHRQ